MSTAHKIQLAPDEVCIQEALKDGRAKIEVLSMKALGTPDPRYQGRWEHLNRDHCHRLDLILQQQGYLAPVVVFRAIKGERQKLLMADGFHRHDVIRVAGLPSIRAYVFDVPWDRVEREALMFAAMANQVTLLSRTKEDLRKVVGMLLSDPECWGWSDKRIAEHTGVSPSTVVKYRAQYAEENSLVFPEVVVTSDGRPVRRTPRRAPRVGPGRGGGGKEGFKAMLGKKTLYEGPNREKAEMRARETASELSGRLNLDGPDGLAHWLNRRSIKLSHTYAGSGRHPAVLGLHGRGVVLAATDFGPSRTVPWALGCVQMLRAISGKPGDRLVVVCYPDSGPKASIDLARDLGVEFLTPDELVASLTPKA